MCYCPVALFFISRFRWQLLALNANFFPYVGIVAMAGGLCALLDYSLVFSPLPDALQLEGFADFIRPESAYVQKHCPPINFVQDGKTYSFGICDLVMDSSGQIDDFSFVYDTSHDVGNYARLSGTDKIVFINVVRKYFSDDPNEQFENADFTATRYYHDFFEIVFDDANAEGFVRDFGMPPENPKNPYPPMYW